MYAERMQRARARMDALGVDVLLLSVGPDLPYLTGYEAMPLERLTMLVVPRGEGASLLVPRLEAPRIEEQPDVFTIVPWEETANPIALVAERCGRAAHAAIGDHTWSRFLLALEQALPSTRFTSASAVTGPLRIAKDATEVEALRAAGAAVDAVAADMRNRPFAGRTEAELHRELVDRMLDAGHERANFAIVASGPNAASPHHEPGDRVIREGEVVLCDFGGTMKHYCSDITRMFVVGEPAAEISDAYAALVDAQERAVQAATIGTPCQDVDTVARGALGAAGLADAFIHRTGHGIGVEAHEDPYLVAGNDTPLADGHAFSIEPGVYLAGRFGLRLEDIVVARADGPERLNRAARDLAVVA